MRADPSEYRKCDIVWVDGGHTADIARDDLTNFQSLASPGSLVMVDDCPFRLVGKKPIGIRVVEEVFLGFPGVDNKSDQIIDPESKNPRAICKGNYAGRTTTAPKAPLNHDRSQRVTTSSGSSAKNPPELLSRPISADIKEPPREDRLQDQPPDVDKRPSIDECIRKAHELKQNLRNRGFSNIPDDAHHEGLGGEQIEGGSTNAEFAAIVEETRQFFRRENDPSTTPSAKQVPPRPKICQTGFNYGTSAAAFLCAEPTADLFSFDLGRHTYVQAAFEEVDKLFPGGRHTLILGDSQETLPTEVEKMQHSKWKKCDVVWVDGGHTFQVAFADLENFRTLARPGSLVMVDDCPRVGLAGIQAVELAWEATEGVENKRAQQLDKETKGQARNICKGNYGESGKIVLRKLGGSSSSRRADGRGTNDVLAEGNEVKNAVDNNYRNISPGLR